mmetsp:Transcript_68442/g.155031  ORF Transcript_68442/g.155031 Transcript_68442/m.155031 type:complete len:228 (-) Transcript_68442:166-849(-)
MSYATSASPRCSTGGRRCHNRALPWPAAPARSRPGRCCTAARLRRRSGRPAPASPLLRRPCPWEPGGWAEPATPRAGGRRPTKRRGCGGRRNAQGQLGTCRLPNCRVRVPSVGKCASASTSPSPRKRGRRQGSSRPGPGAAPATARAAAGPLRAGRRSRDGRPPSTRRPLPGRGVPRLSTPALPWPGERRRGPSRAEEGPQRCGRRCRPWQRCSGRRRKAWPPGRSR